MYLNGRICGRGLGVIWPWSPEWVWPWQALAAGSAEAARQQREAALQLVTPELTPAAPLTEPMLTRWTPEIMTEAMAQRQAGFVRASTPAPVVTTIGREQETPWLLYIGLGVGALALLLLATRR